MEILTLGEKIRRKRKSLRLTLKDVAGSSVTPAQLSYVESNKCKPSSSLLKYICDRIGLEMEYVIESETQQAKRYCKYYLDEYEFYMKRGEYSEAEGRLIEIERVASEYKLDNYIADVLYKKGLGELKLNNYDMSEYNLLGALQLFMKHDNTRYISECYYNLGIVALERGRTDDSLEFFMKYYDIIKDNQLKEIVMHEEEECNTRIMLINTLRALLYIKESNYKEAAGYIKEILIDLRMHGTPRIKRYLLKCASSLLSHGYRDMAETVLGALEGNMEGEELNAMYSYLKFRLKQCSGDDNSMEYLYESLSYVKGIKDKDIQSGIMIDLGRLYSINGEYSKALEYMLEGLGSISLEALPYNK